MDDPSVLRVGALASFGAALSYVLTGISALFMPPELQGRPEISAHEFWTVLALDPTAHLFFHWCWISVGFFGVAAVPTISLLVWRANPGAVLWAGLLGFYGFAVAARSHLMEVAWDRKIIPLYANAEPAFQQAVHVVAGLALDVPDGFLTYGAIGTWVLVVSVLALRSEDLRPAFAYLGFAAAAALFAGLIGYGFLLRPFVVFAVGVGGVLLVPGWFLWAGAILWRSRSA